MRDGEQSNSEEEYHGVARFEFAGAPHPVRT
jgi:hypothetical protein